MADDDDGSNKGLDDLLAGSKQPGKLNDTLALAQCTIIRANSMSFSAVCALEGFLIDAVLIRQNVAGDDPRRELERLILKHCTEGNPFCLQAAHLLLYLLVYGKPAKDVTAVSVRGGIYTVDCTDVSFDYGSVCVGEITHALAAGGGLLRHFNAGGSFGAHMAVVYKVDVSAPTVANGVGEMQKRRRVAGGVGCDVTAYKILCLIVTALGVLMVGVGGWRLPGGAICDCSSSFSLTVGAETAIKTACAQAVGGLPNAKEYKTAIRFALCTVVRRINAVAHTDVPMLLAHVVVMVLKEIDVECIRSNSNSLKTWTAAARSVEATTTKEQILNVAKTDTAFPVDTTHPISIRWLREGATTDKLPLAGSGTVGPPAGGGTGERSHTSLSRRVAAISLKFVGFDDLYEVSYRTFFESGGRPEQIHTAIQALQSTGGLCSECGLPDSGGMVKNCPYKAGHVCPRWACWGCAGAGLITTSDGHECYACPVCRDASADDGGNNDAGKYAQLDIAGATAMGGGLRAAVRAPMGGSGGGGGGGGGGSGRGGGGGSGGGGGGGTRGRSRKIAPPTLPPTLAELETEITRHLRVASQNNQRIDDLTTTVRQQQATIARLEQQLAEASAVHPASGH